MLMLTLSAAFAQQTGGSNLLYVTVGEHVDGSTPTDSLTTDSLVADTLALDTIAEPVALPWPQNVQARLDAILKSRQFQTTQIALQVYDLTADSVIYQYNERQQMRPASTMKMINAVTSLDRLGAAISSRRGSITRARWIPACCVAICIVRAVWTRPSTWMT